MLPTFHLRASRDGGLPEGAILHLPQYAAEIHRIGDVVSDYPIQPNDVISVDASDHSPYDIVVASLRRRDDWYDIRDSIIMREGCWTCVWLPPFDVTVEGESLRRTLGVSAVGAVGVRIGVGPTRTVISSEFEDRTILGDGPRAIWNAIFLSSGKYPASLRTLEAS